MGEFDGGHRALCQQLLYGKDTVVFVEILVMLVLAAVLILIVQSWRIVLRLDHLVEGRRLSAKLRFEPASVKLEDSTEPNKEILLSKVLALVGSSEASHPDPETEAHIILSHSGVRYFVKDWVDVMKGLARLVANGDEEGQEEFLRELVNQL